MQSFGADRMWSVPDGIGHAISSGLQRLMSKMTQLRANRLASLGNTPNCLRNAVLK